MLIMTFARSYDLENYSSASVLLTNPTLQAEWVKFAKNTITPPCVVADADFNSIMSSVKSKNFHKT